MIGRRLLAAVPVLLGVSVLTFLLVDWLPGNAARQLLGAEAAPAQVAKLEAQLHLDRPVAVRYWVWLTRAVRGDLGRSLASDQPVTELLRERLPVTFELVAYALVLALAFALPAALLAARKPLGPFDRGTMTLSMLALSAPTFVIALVLVLLFAVQFSLLPSIGFTPLSDSVARNIETLTLPALSLAIPLFGLYARFLRGDLLEQVGREAYIVTAQAKGMTPWRVLTRHALRNSLFGLLTLAGLHVAALIGGTVIVEQIFALPGLGQLLLIATDTRDVVVVQAVTLVLASVVVLANLAVDTLYLLLDARLRYGGS